MPTTDQSELNRDIVWWWSLAGHYFGGLGVKPFSVPVIFFNPSAIKTVSTKYCTTMLTAAPLASLPPETLLRSSAVSKPFRFVFMIFWSLVGGGAIP